MTSSPESWSLTLLGELVEVLDFARIPVSAPERSKRLGSVPYYGAAGQVGWIDKPIFDEPLVLLGEDGVQFFDAMKSKAYTISGPAWVNNHAHVLRARPALDRRYLLHFLNQFDYRGFANGTTRLKLTQAAMRRMPISYPELDEQRRIVDILEDHLSRLDKAKALLQHTDVRSRAVQIAWVDAEMSSWHAPQMNLGTLVTDSRTGWDRARSFIVTGAEGHKYLKMNNISDEGRLDLDSYVRVSGDAAQADRYRLVAGDVLFNNRNSAELVGKAAVADERVAGWTYNNNIVRIRFSPDVLPEFASIQMNSRPFRRRLRQLVSASTNVAAIYTRDLVRLPFVLPALTVQADFAIRHQVIADDATHLQAVLADAVEHAGSLRRALLVAAFSGRLTGRSSDMEMVEEMAGV